MSQTGTQGDSYQAWSDQTWAGPSPTPPGTPSTPAPIQAPEGQGTIAPLAPEIAAQAGGWGALKGLGNFGGGGGLGGVVDPFANPFQAGNPFQQMLLMLMQQQGYGMQQPSTMPGWGGMPGFAGMGGPTMAPTPGTMPMPTNVPQQMPLLGQAANMGLMGY